jgi:DNA-binding NarL/FixJ family response regulator
MATISTLLVDDNSDFLRAAMAFLAVDGRLKVVGAARSGSEAIDKVASLAPALVLMDWAMPGMDGPTAIRHLKSQAQPPCIIMLTQHDTDVYRTQAAEAGADGFVSKSEFGVRLLPLITAVCPNLDDDPDDQDTELSSLAA